MVEMEGYIDFDGMLNAIPAGEERERAAIGLDKFLGIEHIPTEGFEDSALRDTDVSSSGALKSGISEE